MMPKAEAEKNGGQLPAAHQRLGRLLNRLLLAALLALAAVQLRLYLGRGPAADTWYGELYNSEVRDEEIFAGAIPALALNDGLWGSVTLELVGFSRLDEAAALLNGRRAGSFKEAELTLMVAAGDELAVDCTAYAGPVRLRLKRASSGIDRSFLLYDATLCGERLSWGKIVFEQESL